MKKTILSLVLLLLICAGTQAQSPLKFKYQSIVRDNQGQAIVNQVVGFRFTIIKGSAGGMEVYSELHAPTTNAFGLVNLEIGGGGVISGSMDAIEWGSDDYYLKTEVDAKNDGFFMDMGTTQLLSVPYALFAEQAGNAKDTSLTNELQVLSLHNDSLTISNGNVVLMGKYLDNTDAQLLKQQGGELSITNGNSILLNVNDADSNSQNELQSLLLSGDTLFVSQGGYVNLGSFNNMNELNKLSKKTSSDSFYFAFWLFSKQQKLDTLATKVQADSNFFKSLIDQDRNNLTLAYVKIYTDSLFFKNLIDANQSDIAQLGQKSKTDSLYLDQKIDQNKLDVDVLEFNRISDSSYFESLVEGHKSADLDQDSLNEVQSLSFSKDTLFLSGSNHVVLPYDTAFDFAVFEEQKSSGTDAGSFSAANQWETRALNTTVNISGQSISRSGNKISLDAGTYRIVASAPAYGCGSHKIRFYNDTDKKTALTGTTEQSLTSGSGSYQSSSRIDGVITITAQKSFYLQHIISYYVSGSTDQKGKSSGFGDDEVYSRVYIQKL